MNMYNPMNNMRNEDQYNAAAAFMHNYQSLMGFDMNALAAAAMNPASGSVQPQRHDSIYDQKNYHDNAGSVNANVSGMAQQRSDAASSMVPNTTIPPPPGFSGPPSNIGHFMPPPPQQNLASLFAMQPQYPTQLPFSFMMPNVSGNSQQHKMAGHPSFHQEDNTFDIRAASQQQKQYGQQNQMDKYGAGGQKVDRMGPGTQSTTPSQMNYGQPHHGTYMPQMHGSKKTYNHNNWNS